MRPSVTASPPVQPICSSSSGTGSVSTTALPNVVCRPAERPARRPGVQREHDLAARGRCRPGVSSRPGLDGGHGRVLEELDAGVAGGPLQRQREPRRLHDRAVAEEDAAAEARRVEPLPGSRPATASSSTPSSRAARSERSTAASSASVAATFSSPPSRSQTSSPRCSRKSRTAGTIRLDAWASWSAAAVAEHRRGASRATTSSRGGSRRCGRSARRRSRAPRAARRAATGRARAAPAQSRARCSRRRRRRRRPRAARRSGGAVASGRCARASSSHHDGRDGSGGFRLRGRIAATLSRRFGFQPGGERRPRARDVRDLLVADPRRARPLDRRRAGGRVRRFVFENGLSLFFGAIFLRRRWSAQSFAGQHAFNAEQLAHERRAGLLARLRALARLRRRRARELAVGVPPVHALHPRHGLARAEGVERVEAARGRRARVGPKQQVGRHAPDDAPRWAKRGAAGARLLVRELAPARDGDDLPALLGRAVAEQLARVQRRAARARRADARLVGATCVDADFWERTLQNWQSEFLAVGTMAVFTIYLRQRGSPESKPVGSPHDETGASG